MRILLILNRQKENKKGLSPIYCRVTIRGQRAEFSTGIFVFHKDWNQDTGTITSPDPQTEGQNLLLAHLRADLQMIKLTSERAGIEVTAEMLRAYIQRQSTPPVPEMTVAALIGAFLYEKSQDPGFRSLSHYELRLDTLKVYLNCINKPQMLAKDIDINFGNAYINYLKGKNYHNNTTYKLVQVLSTMVKFGMQKGIVQKNEISYIKMHYQLPVTIETITEEQRDMLDSYEFASPVLIHAKDLFLLQCWTGVEYADLDKLLKTNVYEYKAVEMFEYYRQKTNTIAELPFYPRAKEILERHKWSIEIYSNVNYNLYLKEIAKVLNWRIRLTTNVGRRSFGQHRVNEGHDMTTVAKMLGHTNVKTTQNWYARTGKERIVYELRKLQGALN